MFQVLKNLVLIYNTVLIYISSFVFLKKKKKKIQVPFLPMAVNILVQIYAAQEGKTSLHLVAANNYIKGFQFILTKFKQHALVKSLKGDLPIHISSKKGHIKAVEIFLEQQ